MFVNNQKRFSRMLGLCLLAGTMLTLAPTPAHAGFSWTPPPAPPPKEKAAAPDMAAAPLLPVEGDKAPSASAAPAPAPAPVAMDTPAAPAAAMPAPAATPPAPPQMAMPEYTDIKGFGSDIPLSMALHQIVPAGYSWSLAPGVDPNTSVSWQGDRPWNVVLNDSLQSAGLMATINDHAVSIQRTGGMTPGDQMRGAMAAEGAWMGPIEQKYTPDQLAAIGADSKGYHPSYPRHTPRKMDGDRKAATAATQSSAQAAMPPSGPAASPASVTVGETSAQSGPTPLADHMQQDNNMMPAAGAPPPPPSALDVNAVSSWKAEKGKSLHDTLKEWCDRSNVDLVWEAHKDYKINQKLSVSGTFPEAVMKLLTTYNKTSPRPVGQLHPNLPNGPSILIIQNPSGA
jgi:hypothetical protein